MKKTILLLAAFVGLLLGLTSSAFAQLKPVDGGSSLKFTVQNLGFDVDGTFNGFQGKLLFDPQNPSAASFDVTIDATTVNTDNHLRDEHLRAEGYFDVKNYPRIRLVSSKVSGKNGAYSLTGQLTIKGKTQQVSFPFTATPTADGYNFKGSFKIKRKDFDVGGTSTISNELTVDLNVHAVKA
ncbi:YceI family protein [Mucilaginibacter sp. X4EP1]|uniref:YceI family protein n=1 Tax=Mucilaginibacter sp. X4EP1 TaxID=2723092 RepID=UPI00216A1ED6|nr:YceI family protein [Mucilaginibacter sp. X4EP1]MCS3814048.1 polyisoprenoid-binding protein YceI [Mucilaginibacter sp. X4EP1]